MVAAEISYLLEQRRHPYALLDLDFLGWGVNSVFVLAYFVPGREDLRGIREAVGCPGMAGEVMGVVVPRIEGQCISPETRYTARYTLLGSERSPL